MKTKQKSGHDALSS